MCGIAGFTGYPSLPIEHAQQVLVQMGNSLHHRGPDDKGVLWMPELSTGLAHARLSIQDVSSSGHQPMFSAQKRFVVAFNGEIYNFEVLREELCQLGCQFIGSSDTEVLLHGFDSWGVMDTLKKISGMFAIALVDRHLAKLYLIRDRLGEKPLYYRVSARGLSFSSEMTALTLLDDWQGDIDPCALQAMLRYNNVPAPLSIYQGVEKLRPGACLEWDLKTSTVMNVQTYWSVEKAFSDGMRTPLDLKGSELRVKMQDRLNEIIGRQMVADVPLGAFLSGGIDSSLVTASMQSMSSRPVKTFTIGFDVPGFNEAEQAMAVANYLGTDHSELYVKPGDALDLIPHLGDIYDEPFGDSSQIPTYLVAKMAREKVTVALSGDGGDEFFAGYARYLAVIKRYNSSPGTIEWLKAHMPARLLAQLPFLNLTYDLVAGKQQGLNYRTDSLQDAYHQWTFPSWPSDHLVSAQPSMRATEVPASMTSPRSMMLDDALGYLPNDILVKSDRAAMASSLECRMPFLDHRWVELTCRIPWQTLIQDGQGKWPLRQLLYQHVPQALVDRPKQGFAIPLGPWLRDELREWGEALLFDANRCDLINDALVKQLWAALQQGRDDYNAVVWNLLMFYQWWRCRPIKARR